MAFSFCVPIKGTIVTGFRANPHNVKSSLLMNSPRAQTLLSNQEALIAHGIWDVCRCSLGEVRRADTGKGMFGVQTPQSHRQFEPGGDLLGFLF